MYGLPRMHEYEFTQTHKSVEMEVTTSTKEQKYESGYAAKCKGTIEIPPRRCDAASLTQAEREAPTRQDV